MTEVSIQNCWVCGKKLNGYNPDIPFHCDKSCQSKCSLWGYALKPVDEEETEIVRPKSKSAQVSSAPKSRAEKPVANSRSEDLRQKLIEALRRKK